MVFIFYESLPERFATELRLFMSFFKAIRLISLCSISTFALAINTTTQKSFAHGYFEKNTHSQFAKLGGEKTAICFLNDYFEGPEWGQTVKHEFVKLIIDKAPHIMVTHDILKGLITFRKELLDSLAIHDIHNPLSQCIVEDGKLCYKNGMVVPLQNQLLEHNLTELFAFDQDEWIFYDTGLDLFYIRHKDAPERIGINIDRFTYIPDVTLINPTPTRNNWANKIHLLFKPQEWNERAQQHDKKTFIFFCGHGSEKARYPGEEEYACGMTSNNFAKIMKYFNENLKFEMMGIITCFWTTERLFELARKECRIRSLNYSLFTPICIETSVWIYLRPNLEEFNNAAGIIQYAQAYPDFFQALKRVACKKAGFITSAMKKFLQYIDPVVATKECEGNFQRPNIIYAGQSHVEYLD